MKKWFGLFLCLFQFSVFAHPIKITTCLVEKTASGVLVNFHFFADDFGAHLEQENNTTVLLENPDQVTLQVVQSYIKSHFALAINEKKLAFQLVDYSFKDNVFQIRFKADIQFDYQEGETGIYIENRLLLEAFDDQSNLVRIDLSGKENYHSFRFQENEESYTGQL